VRVIEDCCSPVVVSRCCEKLVAEVGDRSRTQWKDNVSRWSRYQATAVKLTVNTCVCVRVHACIEVHCTMQSRAVSKSPINPITNPNPAYNHTHTRDNTLSIKNKEHRVEWHRIRWYCGPKCAHYTSPDHFSNQNAVIISVSLLRIPEPKHPQHSVNQEKSGVNTGRF
jgi:hypothetical protein